jgi:hypothetical protein
MALHLNLYHEVTKAKALKRRDPLKLSIYALVAIIACFAGYYITQVIKVHGISTELNKVKAEFTKLEPEAKAAKKREEELHAEMKAGELLVKRVETRFYWAPMLAQIMEIVPRDVQVTRLVGDLSGDGMRRCQISLDGLSAGTDARKVAEDLRTAIAEKLSPNYKNVSSKFRTLEDGTEMVMLDGKQVPTAIFAINVELFTGDDKAAAQPVRKAKK